MKYTFKIIISTLVVALLLAVTACKKKNTNPTDSSSVDAPTGILTFHLHTNIDATEVDAYNIDVPTTEGRVISLSMAQMYISEIELVKLDGSTLSVPGTEIKVFESEAIEVGNVPIGNYKSVRFKVGLPAAANALNPSSSKDSIILNRPEMWFSSAAQPDGYVFMNVQGKIDTTAAMNGTPIAFSYKIGTNTNYVQIAMPDRNFTVLKDQVSYVHMIADYSRLFDGIDLTVLSNLSVNSVSDNALPLAAKIKNNIPKMFIYE